MPRKDNGKKCDTCTKFKNKTCSGVKNGRVSDIWKDNPCWEGETK